jgi:hypothetical protein
VELAQNVDSLGWDLADLQERGLLALDHVRIAASDIQETGEWDLDGLFIRLGVAIDSVGAKRIVLDTVEALFGAVGVIVLDHTHRALGQVDRGRQAKRSSCRAFDCADQSVPQRTDPRCVTECASAGTGLPPSPGR